MFVEKFVILLRTVDWFGVFTHVEDRHWRISPKEGQLIFVLILLLVIHSDGAVLFQKRSLTVGVEPLQFIDSLGQFNYFFIGSVFALFERDHLLF